ncbi:hypothetical protein F2Q70_00033627 [Brassica cretica]|uniref:Uncharacterized protein n=1 Tax=Brassica cretica TaxID=69181 RepID=A0A8S9FLF8_BRACR|nr:hypothetical protein F2Q70_00033627 [Brassica cretica]
MAAKRSSKLTQTAMLKQIIKRCSSLGKKQCYDEEGLPLDVPKGHFPVYVGICFLIFKTNKFPHTS